jgi:hypothetical protein
MNTNPTIPMNTRIFDPLHRERFLQPPAAPGEFGENPTIPTNQPYPLPREAPYPTDSVLQDFMVFAREYSESEDCMLIGAVLPLVARLLARRVYIPFAGRKYPNLYSLLVTKPGLRKSTNIRLVEHLGRALLPPSAFLGGATSEQALFKQYLGDPDRLLIEDEGNTVLANWSADAAGKIVAKRFLRLYDCGDWQQDYIRQSEEEGAAWQCVSETSTSLLIGTTLNNCRFHGLETRDGMRRRVLYYVSDDFARTIDWPQDLHGEEFARLSEKFRPLLQLSGEMKLTPEARSLWNDLQKRNREDIRGIHECDDAAEAYGSALAEEQSKALKLAMLFETCRWVTDPSRDWRLIQRDTLQLAADHGRHCLAAGRSLDTMARRSEIREQADATLATIRIEFRLQAKQGAIVLSRSELTNRFASHPNRRGAVSPSSLYSEIIPDLLKRGLVRALPKTGKLQVYQFSVLDP